MSESQPNPDAEPEQSFSAAEDLQRAAIDRELGTHLTGDKVLKEIVADSREKAANMRDPGYSPDTPHAEALAHNEAYSLAVQAGKEADKSADPATREEHLKAAREFINNPEAVSKQTDIYKELGVRGESDGPNSANQYTGAAREEGFRQRTEGARQADSARWTQAEQQQNRLANEETPRQQRLRMEREQPQAVTPPTPDGEGSEAGKPSRVEAARKLLNRTREVGDKAVRGVEEAKGWNDLRRQRKEAGEAVSSLNGEYEQKAETRGEVNGEVLEEAYAGHEARTLAALATKSGRVEHARKLVDMAHTREQEAVGAYRKAKESIPDQVDEMVENIHGMLVDRNTSGNKNPIRLDIELNDTSPDLNVQLLHETKARFGAAQEPSITRRVEIAPKDIEVPAGAELPPGAEQARSMMATELVYPTKTSPNLVYTERWSEDGQLISARLVALDKPAFEQHKKRLGRNKPADSQEANLSRLRPREETITALDQIGTNDEPLEAQDFSDRIADASRPGRMLGRVTPVTEQLRSYGLDDKSINYITGRQKKTGRRKRPGVWANLFGRK